MLSIEGANKEDIVYLLQAMACLLAHVRDSSQDGYLLRLADDALQDSEQWIEKVLATGESMVYVAKQDGTKPVGYIIGSIVRPFITRCRIKHIGLIEHCWVETEQRRAGIAAALVGRLETWFKEKSIEFVEVQYLLGNTHAEVTWQKLGYQPYRVLSRKAL